MDKKDNVQLEEIDLMKKYNIINQVSCTCCGRANNEGTIKCCYCGEKLNMQEINRRIEAIELSKQKKTVCVDNKELNTQEKILELAEMQYEGMAKCPRCDSTSLVGNKKGFGIGKAIVGATLFGALGLLAGGIGSKKVQVTCLKCGNKFNI